MLPVHALTGGVLRYGARSQRCTAAGQGWRAIGAAKIVSTCRAALGLNVGYQVLGCRPSDADRLARLCLHVGDFDLDLARFCFFVDFFPLFRVFFLCSFFFSSLSPSGASLISERSELAPLDTSAA